MRRSADRKWGNILMGFLDGKVAIVTAGAGVGMGSAICKAFAKQGAAVVVADIAEASAEKVASEIKSSGGKALAIPVDVSKAADVERMTQLTIREFGTVSILVNHAGILGGGPIEELTEEQWDRSLGVHLKGAFLCYRAVVPHMKKQRWGRIISTTSRAGYRLMRTSRGLSDYAAAKAAMTGLARAVAVEVGSFGITVNVVAPGVVSGSGMGAGGAPAGGEEQKQAEAEGQALPARPVRPDEIAGTYLYLVGPDSSLITGMVFHVNGGSYFPA
jgi:3-oxoacyl-[acyl-carrier protein] reductase